MHVVLLLCTHIVLTLHVVLLLCMHIVLTPNTVHAHSANTMHAHSDYTVLESFLLALSRTRFIRISVSTC